MNKDLHLQDISSINQALVSRNLSLSEIYLSCYNRISSNEHVINAWQAITPIDRQGILKPSGPLGGLCVGIKDIFSTIEFETSMGTDKTTWVGTKGGFDARVVSKIRAAGASIIGKNKTSEFAVHEPTNTLNPKNHRLIPGTSSSGSAAAVSAGHVSISFASQTAGSIARPASYCGVIGFKPTFGEIPRTGVLKTTETFDTIGIIGNSVSNISTVFNLARVHDKNHPLHLQRTKLLTKSQRFFYAIGPMFDEASSSLRANSITLVKKLLNNAEIFDFSEFSKINFKELRNCHNNIYAKELSYFLKNEMNSETVSKNLKEFSKFGAQISNSLYNQNLDFLKSQRRQSDLEINNGFVFALSAANEAPAIGGKDKQDSNLFWTALGLPQISLPILKSENGNPIGLSIIGSKGSDLSLLNFAQKIFPDFTEVN